MEIKEDAILEYSEARPGKENVSPNSLIAYLPILKDVSLSTFLNIHRESRFRDLIKTNQIFYDVYNIQLGDRWDIISNKAYGTPHLWWLICFVNDIVDPDEALSLGEEIILLKSSYIYDVLNELEKIRNW